MEKFYKLRIDEEGINDVHEIFKPNEISQKWVEI